MFRRFLVAAVVVLALVSRATAVVPAAARTNEAVVTHKLIVAVKKNLAPAAEKRLAVLVLISQNGRAPVSAETPGRLENPQLGLFPSAPDPVLKELLALELSTLTPLQALNLLHEWQQRLRSQP